MLGVGAEVFALFLEAGPGRRQVFNEYFHSSSRFGGTRLLPVAWSAAGAPGEEGEKSAEWGARGVAGRGGVKGSAGGGWTLGARWVHTAPARGGVITGRLRAGCDPGPDSAQPRELQDEQRGRGLGRGFGKLPSGLWDQ